MSFVMSWFVQFFAVFFPRDVLAEIWDLIESAPEFFSDLLLYLSDKFMHMPLSLRFFAIAMHRILLPVHYSTH